MKNYPLVNYHAARSDGAKNGDPSPTLDIMVAYDDIDAAKRAKELCDRICHHFGPRFQLKLSVWKLSMFKFPEICRAATLATDQVAAIVFAVHGAQDMLPQASLWIETVIGQSRSNPDYALVALLHDIPRTSLESAPAGLSLSRFAQKGGMNFFSEVIESREEESECSIEASNLSIPLKLAGETAQKNGGIL